MVDVLAGAVGGEQIDDRRGVEPHRHERHLAPPPLLQPHRLAAELVAPPGDGPLHVGAVDDHMVEPRHLHDAASVGLGSAPCRRPSSPSPPSTPPPPWWPPPTTSPPRPGWPRWGGAATPSMPPSPPTPSWPSPRRTCAAWAATCSPSCTATAGPPAALDASGRAGRGADPERLRAEGHTAMPFRHDIRTVDGARLRRRLGRPARALRAPAARRRAGAGHRLRRRRLPGVAVAGRRRRPGSSTRRRRRRPSHALPARPVRAGDLVAPPGCGRGAAGHRRRAAATASTAASSATGCWRSAAGEYTDDDLATPAGRRGSTPLDVDAWGHRLWTIPPNSQGYLTLAAALDRRRPRPARRPRRRRVGPPPRRGGRRRRPRPPRRPRTTAPTATRCWRRAPAAAARSPSPRSGIEPAAATGGAGDTTYLCAVDGDGMGVSLIQSNASGFGSRPRRAEHRHQPPQPRPRLLPRRRPPGRVRPRRGGRPTRCRPALVTTPDGALRRRARHAWAATPSRRSCCSSLARLLHDGQSPGRRRIGRRRWALQGPTTGLRHVDRRRGADGGRRRPCARGVGRRARATRATGSQPRPPSTAASGTPHVIVVDPATAGPAGRRRRPTRPIGAAVGSRCRPLHERSRRLPRPPSAGVRFDACASIPTSSAPCRCPTPATRRSPRRRGGTATTPSSRATRTCSHWAKTADELGFDTMWLTEHHFQYEGYEVLPNLIHVRPARWPTQTERPALRADVQRRAAVASAAPGRGLRPRRHPHRRPHGVRRRARHGAARGVGPRHRRGLAATTRCRPSTTASTARSSRRRWRSSSWPGPRSGSPTAASTSCSRPTTSPTAARFVNDLTLIPKPTHARRHLPAGHVAGDDRVRARRPATRPSTGCRTPTARSRSGIATRSSGPRLRHAGRAAARIAASCSTSTSAAPARRRCAEGRPGHDEFNKFLSPYGRFCSYQHADGSRCRSATSPPSRSRNEQQIQIDRLDRRRRRRASASGATCSTWSTSASSSTARA